MSRRRRLTVYTSSSSDDEDDRLQPHPQNPNHPQPPQQPSQQPPPPPPSHDQNAVFDEPMAIPEEEDDIEIPSPNQIPNIDTVTLNTSHTTTSTTATTTAAVSVGISDEYFMDVSPAPVVSANFVPSDCPVNDELRKMGLNLKREWLDSCKLGLQNTNPGFSKFDVETTAKLCFGQFLYSDMNCTGAGILPENVHQLHLVDLAGPFVLQVDEIINISCPLKERYKNAAAGHKRCLKLSLTDGIQRVFGMEYRPIKSLEALAPAGFKVVIQNVNIRRGLLMLVPEVLEILGGSVEELEAARQRLVHEVNKPPRGKRTRSGIVPPLSARATRAAWVQNDVSNETTLLNDANHGPGSTADPMLRAATHFCENTLGVDRSSRMREAPLAGRVITELPTLGRTDQHSASRDSSRNYSVRESTQRYNSVETRVLPSSWETTVPRNSRESSEHLNNQQTDNISTSVPPRFSTFTEAPEQASSIECSGLNPVSATAIENEDTLMFDCMEHPFILSGEKESPFIYLASLSAKWAAVQGNKPSVRGKIKCLLTGVKSFQYKGQSTFKLRVYVEDGSLISEIFIHHNVVQKAIGYSPEEVNAALSSSDDKLVGDMKNRIKQFQLFLMNFEGTMLVEMNETYTIPVALEMNQSCSVSDAWLLLQRLKTVSSSPMCLNGQSEVINLSP